MRLRDVVRERGLWLLSAVTLAMFWRPLAIDTFFFRDIYLLFYPKKLFLVDAIRSGVPPFWDPLTNGGQPYLANPANFAFHPSNVLYFVLPPIVAFNWVLVLHVLFCAIAAYWLARTLNLPQTAAFVSGAVFALCGFTLSAANLTPVLLALPWIPVTVGLTHRALRDGRSVAPAAIAAALPLYSGAAEVAAMLFATLIVWVGVTRYDGVSRWGKAAAVATVIVFAAGLSALQTLPASSVIAQSSRSQRRSYQGFTTWSVSPQRLPELVIPRFFGPIGTLADRDYWGHSLESNGFPYILSLYFGVPVLLLAIAGASRACNAEVPRRALAIVTMLAVVLSLGRWLPGFRLIYDLVPLVATFRYPAKAIIVALLPISLLAGCGVVTIADRRRVAVTIAVTAAAVCVFLMISSGFVTSFARVFSFDTVSRPLLAGSFAHVALATAGFAFAVRAPRLRHTAMAAVVALDLATAGMDVNVYAPRAIFDEPPLAAAVRRNVGAGRFYAAERETLLRAPANDIMWLARWQVTTLAGYTAAQFRIPVVFHTDYDGLAPQPIAALSEVVNHMPWNRRRALLDLAGVRVFATTDVVAAAGVKEVATIDAPGKPIRIYTNDVAAPARFVSSIELARNEADAAIRVVKAGDASRTILQHSTGPAERCGTAAVRLVARSLNSAAYEVDAPCAGYVVFAENFYDGWHATIDGRAAEILPADFAFSAVAVGRGKHAIERHFAAPRLVAGAVTSGVALLLLIPAGWLLRRSIRTVAPRDPATS